MGSSRVELPHAVGASLEADASGLWRLAAASAALVGWACGGAARAAPAQTSGPVVVTVAPAAPTATAASSAVVQGHPGKRPPPPAALIEGYISMLDDLDELIASAAGDCRRLGELLDRYLEGNGARIARMWKDAAGTDHVIDVKNEVSADDSRSDQEDRVHAVLTDRCGRNTTVIAAAARLTFEREK